MKLPGEPSCWCASCQALCAPEEQFCGDCGAPLAAIHALIIEGSVYDVRSEIGRGGMGSVYRARSLRFGHDVAIKTFQERREQGPDWRVRLQREADIGQNLAHPNIVRVSNRGPAQNGQFCLVMDYVQGRTLAARLAEGPVPLQEALGWLRILAQAVGHAHERRVIHRDLKPENLILLEGPEQGIKVLDFGIARIGGSGRATDAGLLMGTLLYMAPEQILGQEAGFPSDVYALGCIFYQMLTGVLPWTEGLSQEERAGLEGIQQLVLRMGHYARPSPEPPSRSAHLPILSPAVRQLLDDMLADAPKDRPANGQALLARLEALTPAPTQATSSMRPNRRLIGWAIAALLVTGLGAVLLWTNLAFRSPELADKPPGLRMADHPADLREIQKIATPTPTVSLRIKVSPPRAATGVKVKLNGTELRGPDLRREVPVGEPVRLELQSRHYQKFEGSKDVRREQAGEDGEIVWAVKMNPDYERILQDAIGRCGRGASEAQHLEADRLARWVAGEDKNKARIDRAWICIGRLACWRGDRKTVHEALAHLGEDYSDEVLQACPNRTPP